MANSRDPRRDARAVLTSTRHLIDAVRYSSGLAYADDDWSPVSDINLGIIARQMRTVLEEAPLPQGVQEIGIPGYMGAARVIVNDAIDSGTKRLALRHGLAHLVAGELGAEGAHEVRFMSSVMDYMALEERRADLFAIADIMPDREIDTVLATGAGVRGITRFMVAELQRWAPNWSRHRLEDRVMLRLELFADRR